MIIVKVDKKNPFQKALKQFRTKWKKTRTLKELRERQAFMKPSAKKRLQKQKAVYKQKYLQDNQ
jgi:small subunit ribosomal protein S21